MSLSFISLLYLAEYGMLLPQNSTLSKSLDQYNNNYMAGLTLSSNTHVHQASTVAVNVWPGCTYFHQSYILNLSSIFYLSGQRGH